MKKFLILFLLPLLLHAHILVGTGKSDITPPVGTPSAGYPARKGAGMEGVHDPLLATAVYIYNGEKEIVLCGVDNLGFTYEMVQKLIQKAKTVPQLAHAEIYIHASHTHSGGGAHFNIPLVGLSLAGKYDPLIEDLYIDKTLEAIIHASLHKMPAKFGIGYGQIDLNTYRSTYPEHVKPSQELVVIKITQPYGTPIALIFNYPIHPTVLPASMKQFSADFVGFARDYLFSYLGHTLQPIFINGAQGDINPLITSEDRLAAAKELGDKLADEALKIWNKIDAKDSVDIKTQKLSYNLVPKATPNGLKVPLDTYPTEMNLIVFNKKHAFITIPGELSTLYDQRLKAFGKTHDLHVSIFGLTNDAHGYIITPDAWNHKTAESNLSFGGENYGKLVVEQAEQMIINFKNNHN